MSTKKCSSCHKVCSIDDFTLNRASKDGCGLYCYPCRRIQYLENSLKGNRLKAFQRDKFKCQVCKSTNQLHIHHLIPRTKQGTDELENLITLCEKCHRNKAHQGELTNKLCTCIRCSYAWFARTEISPMVCPKCKSPYWNKRKNGAG